MDPPESCIKIVVLQQKNRENVVETGIGRAEGNRLLESSPPLFVRILQVIAPLDPCFHSGLIVTGCLLSSSSGLSPEQAKNYKKP